MEKLFNGRWIVVVAIGIVAVGVFAGCGKNNGNAGSQTGPGATNGATGNAAGGAAVEAGKIRNPKDVANEKKHFSSEPPPIQITSGDNTGYRVSKPTAVVSQSEQEFRALMKKHFSKGVTKENIVASDYTTRQTVAVFMPQSPKRALISITDVHETGGKIVINVTELLNGDRCTASGKKPRPFQIVETRKMNGTPTLVIKKQKAPSC